MCYTFFICCDILHYISLLCVNHVGFATQKGTIIQIRSKYYYMKT